MIATVGEVRNRLRRAFFSLRGFGLYLQCWKGDVPHPMTSDGGGWFHCSAHDISVSVDWSEEPFTEEFGMGDLIGVVRKIHRSRDDRNE